MSDAAPPSLSADPDTLHQFLLTRQTTHDFTSDAVPQEVLHRALECALRAPNHFLTNPWRFTVLGPQTQRAIAEANARITEARHGPDAAQNKRARWLSVPGWLLVTCVRDKSPIRDRENYAACCCAVQNFTLALHAEGYSAKWTSGGVTRDTAFPQICGYDATRERFVGLIWFGRPASHTPPTRREPLAAVMRLRD